MKWSSMGLFPTPLIKIPLEGSEHTKTFFYNTVYSQENNDKLTHFHSYENVFNLYPTLEELKKNIEEAGSFAYRDLLNFKKSGPLKITSAWFNLCEPGGSQKKHSHANSLLSGTFYLNTDEHTNIEFYHPLSTDSLHAELFDEPDMSKNGYGLSYHFKEVVVSVSQGDCLFWPSQLRHGYKHNKTPARLSLSFNMMPTTLNTTYQFNP